MKNLMNLGTILNKNEQKEINGGRRLYICSPDSDVVCMTAAQCAQDANGDWYCC